MIKKWNITVQKNSIYLSTFSIFFFLNKKRNLMEICLKWPFTKNININFINGRKQKNIMKMKVDFGWKHKNYFSTLNNHLTIFVSTGGMFIFYDFLDNATFLVSNIRIFKKAIAIFFFKFLSDLNLKLYLPHVDILNQLNSNLPNLI